MTSKSEMKIDIVEPSSAQVDECYAIVQSQPSDRKGASTHGFMHGHQSRSDWDRYLKEKLFFVAVCQEEVRGFVIAVSLGGPDTDHLEGARGSVSWEQEGVLEIPNLYFVEKIAVLPAAHGQGIGRAVYEHLFSVHPESTFFTALVEKPLHNQASEAFHSKMGFTRVGTFRDSAFGTLEEYQSGIFLRPLS